MIDTGRMCWCHLVSIFGRPSQLEPIDICCKCIDLYLLALCKIRMRRIPESFVLFLKFYCNSYFRLLEKELQRIQKVSEMRESELRSQVEQLKVDYEKQQNLIGQVCHWSGVSLVRCVIGQVCHWSGVSLVRCVIGQVC